MSTIVKDPAVILIAVILSIIVLTILVNFVNADTIQTPSYVPPTEKVECKTNSDCSHSNNGPFCMIVNGQKNFCGCLEELDCGGRKCINERCR
jgi:hypothetical protein